MSWKIRVRHHTGYEYAGTVIASYNEARISPLDTQSQFIIEHRVEVQPGAHVYRYRDYWGTRVHAFDVHTPHSRLDVIGHSVVETSGRPIAPEVAEISWEQLGSPAVSDRFCEFLAPSRYAPNFDDAENIALTLRFEPTPGQAVRVLGEWIRDHLRYERGYTNANTTADEVFGARAGVCQDFAHLALSVLRAAGIPARYASGYLHPHEEAALNEVVEGQSHAWIEVWLGDWLPIDPTSGAPVAERHLLVARGRDYDDVPPLKGVFHGAPSETLSVTVDLTRVA
ncbi:MAG: transglutaminase family protein [Acidimicrobiia bacterium]